MRVFVLIFCSICLHGFSQQQYEIRHHNEDSLLIIDGKILLVTKTVKDSLEANANNYLHELCKTCQYFERLVFYKANYSANMLNNMPADKYPEHYKSATEKAKKIKIKLDSCYFNNEEYYQDFILQFNPDVINILHEFNSALNKAIQLIE